MGTMEGDIYALEKLLKLGIKEENAIHLVLKSKELELKKLEILNHSPYYKDTDMKTKRIINHIRKRKLQSESNDGFKYRKPNVFCLPLCDNVWGHILSFSGCCDFELLKLILVCKQFYRIITENIQHKLCIYSRADLLSSFCESSLVDNVTNLRIYQPIDMELYNVITSKFKVAHLLITIKDDVFFLRDPPNFRYLESLKIRKTHNQSCNLFSRYCYNLKKLVVSKVGEIDYLPDFINNTTNGISTLKLYGDGSYIYPEDTTRIVNPFLTTLKIKHLQMSIEVIRIIFSCKSLKWLYLNTEDIENNSILEHNEHEQDEYEMPNLEYLEIFCRFSELIASRVRAPKLRTLNTNSGIRDKKDRKIFWNNFENFTNLTSLSLSEMRGDSMISCSNLSNLTHLDVGTFDITAEIAQTNYFSNLKILKIEMITKNGEQLFALNADMNMLEKLEIVSTSKPEPTCLNAIASCQSMKNLKELRALHVRRNINFVRLLSLNPFFSNLEYISYVFADDDVDYLISSPYLKKLKHISAILSIGSSSSTLSSCGLRKLTEWGQLSKIEFCEDCL